MNAGRMLFRWTGTAVIAAALACATASAGDLHEYDPAGRLSRVTYANGQFLEYSYDAASNITSILSGVTSAVSSPTLAFVNSLRVSRSNPAYREAHLRFSLAHGGRTTLRLFDVAGRLVQTLADRDYPPGEYEVRVFLSRRPAGVYFVRLEALEFRATRRLVVLK